jgi:YD repeat-containing protein
LKWSHRIGYRQYNEAGYKQYEKIKQGSAGTEIKLAEYRYTQRTAAGITIYPVAKRIVFRNEDGTGAIETGYAYTWHPDTFQMAQRTTTLPAVPAEQNGSGASATRVEVFDLRGNLTWLRDERGFLTRHSYDIVTGARTQTIADVDVALVADAPEGWTTPSGGGLHLVSDFEHDEQGRITQVLGPLHNANGQLVRTAAWAVYQDADHETWTARGYAAPETDGEGYDYALVNPVSITKRDAGQRITEAIQAVRSTTLGRLSADDSLPQSSYVRWTTHAYQDGQLLWTRIYHAIPAEGLGSRDANYDQTTFGYDSLGRQNMVKSPGGTITRTVFDARGLALRAYVGMDDRDATESDPTGAGHQDNNMVLVTEREYDQGAFGDGNLTKETQHVDDDPQDARVAEYGYDWRNRRVTVDGEVDFFQKAYYDNLDRAVRVDRHDTTGDGNLVGRVETLYDDLGRVYRTIGYAVDPATGSVTGKLTDNAWYDLAGNKIKEKPAGSEKFTKTVYDGLGRRTKAYVGFDVDETSWAEAGNVTGDTIFEQIETAYDAGGNLIQETRRLRMHTALDSQTGELSAPEGADPKARVSYVAHWHDGIGRPIGAADYGTYGGEPFRYADAVPARGDEVLVSTTEYNDRGEAYKTIDAMGRDDLQVFDDASRLIEMVENFKINPQESDESRTTRRSYTADGQIATLTAVNAATGDQVTRYVYGTTLADSQVARSDLLRAEIYPDSDDTSDWLGDGDDRVYDRVEYAYNRQGQVVSKKDQNETVHAYDYDKLGRQTQDRVIQLGPGAHGLVRRIARTYDLRGLPETITSFTNASLGSGDIVNQVQIEYNQTGLPIRDYEAHEGPVDMANTPSVAYGYNETLSGDEFVRGVRRTSLTYPNGRILRYEYTPGADSNLNRVSFLADDDGGSIGTHLAEYTRLGLDQFVRVVYPQPQLRCDLAHGSGPDPYDGLDRFSRVVDLVWRNDATGEHVERIKHGYDRAGNRIYRECPVKGPLGVDRDEFYTYDGLYQLKTFTRGGLNAQKTGIASPSFAQSWDLDSTGNWRGFREDTDGDGRWDLDQTRTHSPANEITDIHETAGLAWITPEHDRNGNMVRIPQPSDPAAYLQATYDAWNRLVKLTDGTKTVAEYQYDGRNFRTIKKTYTAGVLSETRHFYYSDHWQLLEERLDVSTSADRQFVWGPRYIDDLVLRDRDVSDPPNGQLNERLYAMQSNDGSVVAVVDAAQSVASRYIYSGNGFQTVLTSAGVQVLSSRLDWDYGYRAYRIEPALGLGFRNQVFSFCLGRFVSGRYSKVVRSSRDLRVDEEQGSTDCDPQGGPAKTWVNPALNQCARDCVKKHEDTHAEDMNSDTHPIGKCCKAMQKAYNREGLSDEERQKIVAKWKDWIHAPTNEAIAECKAYQATANCAADILTERSCHCRLAIGQVPNINDYSSRDEWRAALKEYRCCEAAQKQSDNAVQKYSKYCEDAKGKEFDLCPDFEHL